MFNFLVEQPELYLGDTELEFIRRCLKEEATTEDLPSNLDEIIYRALQVARQSDDLDVGVSAVVFDGHKETILMSDYNRFPFEVERNPSRLEKSSKLLYTGHAEANVVANASRRGVALAGKSMLVTSRFPCATCAISIVESGIDTIYAPDLDVGNRWYESNKAAMEIFQEVGVKVVILNVLTSTFLKLDKPQE